MITSRIIPRLDVKAENLVKGVRMEGLRVLGKPEAFARQYYLDGADEIIFIDTVASLYGRNNLHTIVERVASEVFIPLTVGGGVRTVGDARSLLRAGADKIAVNTAAVARPELLSDLADAFGVQCVVLYVEAKERDGWWELHTDNAREPSGLEVESWVSRAVSLGAGEILLHAVDSDGTGQGFPEGLARCCATATVPVIASGGLGRVADCVKALSLPGVDAVAGASIFHYLYSDVRPGYLEPIRIADLKEALHGFDVEVRR